MRWLKLCIETAVTDEMFHTNYLRLDDKINACMKELRNNKKILLCQICFDADKAGIHEYVAASLKCWVTQIATKNVKIFYSAMFEFVLPSLRNTYCLVIEHVRVQYQWLQCANKVHDHWSTWDIYTKHFICALWYEEEWEPLLLLFTSYLPLIIFELETYLSFTWSIGYTRK